MPFPDEAGPVELVAYRASWAGDFEAVAHELVRLDLPGVVSIDHIGSTSVPGLAAKDVIDVQVRVLDISDGSLGGRFRAAAFRPRSEPWNRVEQTRSGAEPKLVFAPPTGERRTNIHVRQSDGRGASDNLLFRDFLRADRGTRDAWGDLKCSILSVNPTLDVLGYGQIKQPAWRILMTAADAWASATGWAAQR